MWVSLCWTVKACHIFKDPTTQFHKTQRRRPDSSLSSHHAARSDGWLVAGLVGLRSGIVRAGSSAASMRRIRPSKPRFSPQEQCIVICLTTTRDGPRSSPSSHSASRRGSLVDKKIHAPRSLGHTAHTTTSSQHQHVSVAHTAAYAPLSRQAPIPRRRRTWMMDAPAHRALLGRGRPPCIRKLPVSSP